MRTVDHKAFEIFPGWSALEDFLRYRHFSEVERTVDQRYIILHEPHNAKNPKHFSKRILLDVPRSQR